MIKGAILDVDGTLVDSNEAHAHAFVDAFSSFGWEVPFFRIKWLIGMGGGKLLSTLFPSMSDQDGIGKIIAHRHLSVFLEQYAPSLQPTPGARALLERMKRDGLKLIVATSAKQQELQTLLDRANVADLLPEATTASDVDESKPAPDVVQAALDKLGLAPDEVLMVGDTPYDIQSASKLGVGVVAVRTGGWDDDSLHGAVAVYDSPADILARYDESPLGNGRNT